MEITREKKEDCRSSGCMPLLAKKKAWVYAEGGGRNQMPSQASRDLGHTASLTENGATSSAGMTEAAAQKTTAVSAGSSGPDASIVARRNSELATVAR
jgi:hypothetical protein